METNPLYLSVLPIIHLSSDLTEQVMTLLPSIDTATRFVAFAQAKAAASLLDERANKHLVGDLVTGYQSTVTPHGSYFIVKVLQYGK